MQTTLRTLAILFLATAVALPTAARPQKGQAAPDFTATALDGQRIALADYKGKVGVVTFFAGFTPSARKDFTHLREQLASHARDGLRVIAVSMDEDREQAGAVARETGARFPVIFEPKGTIAERYSVQALPHSLVLDRSGKIAAILIGSNPERLGAEIAAALKD